MTKATQLADQLTEKTVLGEWFQPMDRALDKVRFQDKKFTSLPMRAFTLFGCLRQVQSIPSVREMIQSLFHINEHAIQPPISRSTLCDAYASNCRRDILIEAVNQLIKQAQGRLPDKLAGVEGLGERAVIATDATYQAESCHYYPVSPSQGGVDNKKGHQHLTHFDMRTGIPLMSLIEAESMAEIRLLREGGRRGESDCMGIKAAIHVADRAFIDAAYWDKKKSKLNSTLITCMKSNLNYALNKQRSLHQMDCNQGVVSDHVITLDSSNKP